jgi:membrane protein required for colicin V production
MEKWECAMNWLDIVIVIALVLAVFGGLKNGLVNGVVTLAGLIIGIVLAGRYSDALGAVLPASWGAAANIAGFAIIVIVVLLIGMVVGKLLRGVLKAIMLGWLDRLGGAVFGLLLAAFFWGGLLAVLSKYADSLGSFGVKIADSVLAEFLLDAFPFILGLLPAEFNIVTGFFA